MIEPLGKEDAQHLLQTNHFGHLGCCRQGEPYVVPINYLCCGAELYLHSLTGEKITALRDNPRVCLQVDEVQDDYNWRSVIAFGKYEEVTDPEERAQLLALLFRQFPHLTPVESRLTPEQEAIVFRIRVESLTGVSEHWR